MMQNQQTSTALHNFTHAIYLCILRNAGSHVYNLPACQSCNASDIWRYNVLHLLVIIRQQQQVIFPSLCAAMLVGIAVHLCLGRHRQQLLLHRWTCWHCRSPTENVCTEKLLDSAHHVQHTQLRALTDVHRLHSMLQCGGVQQADCGDLCRTHRMAMASFL